MARTALSLNDILKLAVQKGASDVHLKAGIIPVIRRHGALRPLQADHPALSHTDLQEMANKLLDERLKKKFEDQKDVDISYGLPGIGRFRINILKQRGTVRIVIRNIPDQIKNLEELNMPPILKKIAERQRGLVLVTGATGSGKSSTLAAIVDHINSNQNKHILMIEDPTEFLIKDRKSLITQRELGADTISFAHSLRAALRQDPDVILIGEMRDRETIEIALLAAETGHLVFSTLHTLDAQETINRVLAAFEPHQQMQVRLQLASVLAATISQRLCLRKDGGGHHPALEIMLNNSRISEMISDPAKTADIRRAIEESQSVWSMCTFDQSLMDLVTREIITYEEALKNSTSPENFAIRYSGVSHLDGKKWGDNTKLSRRVEQVWQDLAEIDVEITASGQKKISQKAPPEDKISFFKKRKKS